MSHTRTFSVTSTLAICLCSLAGCLLWCGASASAKEVHVYKSTFGVSGSGPGQLNRPLGVAVNDVTHDVYVVDSGNNRVEEFNSTGSTLLAEFNGSAAPTGAFSEPTEIAIDNSGDPLDQSAGDVYVVDSGHDVVDKFSPAGIYEGQLIPPSNVYEDEYSKFEGLYHEKKIKDVAVDPHGVVWVVQRVQFYAGGKFYSNYYIDSFSDALANAYVSARPTNFGVDGEGLGVSSEDNLYVDTGQGEFREVNSVGETLRNPFSKDLKAVRVAVDPVGGEVYLDNLDSIEAFGLGGEPIESCIGQEDSCFGLGHLGGELDLGGELGSNLGGSVGVAVDSSNGTVYATDETTDNVAVFEGIALPDVGVTTVSEQHTRSVILEGTVNPLGMPVVSCVFEYGTTNAYGSSVPCSPSPAGLGSGGSPVAVDAQLSNLVPGTEYHYRLVAQNSAPRSSDTPDNTFFTGPVLGGESVDDVASSSATLLDTIDPKGTDTHYYIEYGPTDAYGSFAPVAVPGVDLGSSFGSQSLVIHLQGLNAASAYHYRFVAVQNGEIFAEADRSFTTQAGSVLAGLPDGRSWELVSPANKRGAVLELTEDGGQIQAASDGSGITYVGQGPSVDPTAPGSLTYSQILSTRGQDGWVSHDVTLPGGLPEHGESAVGLFTIEINYRLFSSDLSSAAVEPQPEGTPLLSSEATSRTLYLRNNSNGSFAPLVSPGDVPEGTVIEEGELLGAPSQDWEMHFLAATPDLSHVVFESPKALTPEAISVGTIKHRIENHDGLQIDDWNLYEWDSEGLKLVSIMPTPNNSPTFATLAGVNGEGLPRGNAQRSVSADGRRIAWTLGEPFPGPKLANYKGLYVRDMVEERTVRIGGAKATYQTMNSDGSKIFYLENGDLYVYDWNTGVQTDLTADHGVGESTAGVQESVSDVSEDGSYVYFVAKGDLAEGGVGGEYNLYVLHDTGNGWTTKHVATLAPQDQPSWYAELFAAPYLAAVSSRVSPDGRYLAFMSQRPLTGYDNLDAASDVPDEEVYLYDAQGAGKLVCASCDPSGARPHGVLDKEGSRLLVDREDFWAGGQGTANQIRVDHWLAGSIPGWDNPLNDPATYQPRYLSNSGRLFFDSPDGLVGQDENGLEDVYQYEPEGIGDCTSSTMSATDVYVAEASGHQVGGCVGLISSGTSSSESAFYDASENGDDVFFTTTSKLVGDDYDKGYDVYDAHVCTTNVPCKTMLVGPPPCTSGDSCKAAPSPQPAIFGAPPSSTFNGAGNITTSSTGVVVKERSLTNAQKLTRALHACHQKKKTKQRKACERTAHKYYPLKQARKATKTGNARKG